MPDAIHVAGLKVGQMYRIVFVTGQMYSREAVFKYLGEDDDDLLFSARPRAGTQRVSKSTIQELWETTRPVMLPTIYRGEVRVF